MDRLDGILRGRVQLLAKQYKGLSIQVGLTNKDVNMSNYLEIAQSTYNKMMESANKPGISKSTVSQLYTNAAVYMANAKHAATLLNNKSKQEKQQVLSDLMSIECPDWELVNIIRNWLDPEAWPNGY